MNEKKMNELIGEIIHIACGAELAIDEQIKMQAIGDIYAAAADALREAGHGLPVAEKVKGEGQGQGEKVKGEGQGQGGEVKDCHARFLTVSEGVKLMRFSNGKVVKLIAKRAAKCCAPASIFEIYVGKKEKTAFVMKDESMLFKIEGCNIRSGLVEKIAISSLHRWFKDRRPNKRERRKMREAKAQGGDAMPTVKEVA